MSKFFKKLVVSGLSKAGNYMAEVQQLAAEFSRFDDERLMRMYESSSGKRRMACGYVLQQQGYSIRHDD